MLTITYPEPSFRVKKEEGKDHIFDPLRKKWVKLTPEEWVRLNFIQYLVQAKAYPASLIAVEKSIRVGEMRKRFDIVVYDREQRPWMMVECKAADVPLNEEVLQQALRYHISVPVTYIIITNGHTAYGWEKKGTHLELIVELPPMPE